MLWNIAVNDAGAEYDPLTLLRTRTMFGRPDWKSIYGRMREAIETGQYLPGTNAQLKTKVGVRILRVCFMRARPDFCPRPTSAAQVFSQSRLRKPATPPTVPTSTSRSRRSVLLYYNVLVLG